MPVFIETYKGFIIETYCEESLWVAKIWDTEDGSGKVIPEPAWVTDTPYMDTEPDAIDKAKQTIDRLIDFSDTLEDICRQGGS